MNKLVFAMCVFLGISNIKCFDIYDDNFNKDNNKSFNNKYVLSNVVNKNFYNKSILSNYKKELNSNNDSAKQISLPIGFAVGLAVFIVCLTVLSFASFFITIRFLRKINKYSLSNLFVSQFLIVPLLITPISAVFGGTAGALVGLGISSVN